MSDKPTVGHIGQADIAAASQAKTHRQRCEVEGTRDVIFLFQQRQLKWTGHSPDGYGIDGDGNMAHEKTGDPLSLESLLKKHGSDYVIESWRTVGVWLDRDEAEAWGQTQRHNYGEKGTGWRVYGTCSEGGLAELLKTDANAQIKELQEKLAEMTAARDSFAICSRDRGQERDALPIPSPTQEKISEASEGGKGESI